MAQAGPVTNMGHSSWVLYFRNSSVNNVSPSLDLFLILLQIKNKQNDVITKIINILLINHKRIAISQYYLKSVQKFTMIFGVIILVRAVLSLNDHILTWQVTNKLLESPSQFEHTTTHVKNRFQFILVYKEMLFHKFKYLEHILNILGIVQKYITLWVKEKLSFVWF